MSIIPFKAMSAMEPSTLYHALHSGDHPCLSAAEFSSLLPKARVLHQLTQVSLFEHSSDDPFIARAQRISSTIKSVGRVLAITDAGEEREEELVRKMDIECILPEGPVNVTFTRIQSFSKHLRKDRLVDAVREYFRRKCGRRVRSGKPRPGMVNVSIILTDGLVIVSRLLSWEGKGILLSDNPHNLPYYAPGALNRWLANLLTNLASRGDPHAIVYDPMCGTGSVGIPHLDRGGLFLCSDIVRWHCRGALRNLALAAGGGLGQVFRADARSLPLRAEGVDAVLTDLPYGRSVRGRGGGEVELALGFLEGLGESGVIRRGGRLVFMAPLEWQAMLVGGLRGFVLEHACPMYVHEGLTRVVVVARRV